MVSFETKSERKASHIAWPSFFSTTGMGPYQSVLSTSYCPSVKEEGCKQRER